MISFSPADLERMIARKYKVLSAYMDERARRLWAAAEIRELGYEGTALVHRATGLDWKTLLRGERELAMQEQSPSLDTRTRPHSQKRRRKKNASITRFDFS